MRLPGMLGPPRPFLGRERTVRVDFVLKLACHSGSGLRCPRGAIWGLCPGRMRSDPGLKHSIVTGAHATPPDSTGCTKAVTSALLT